MRETPGFFRVCDGLVIARIRATSGLTGHMIAPVQYAVGPKERARGRHNDHSRTRATEKHACIIPATS